MSAPKETEQVISSSTPETEQDIKIIKLKGGSDQRIETPPHYSFEGAILMDMNSGKFFGTVTDHQGTAQIVGSIGMNLEFSKLYVEIDGKRPHDHVIDYKLGREGDVWRGFYEMFNGDVRTSGSVMIPQIEPYPGQPDNNTPGNFNQAYDLFKTEIEEHRERRRAEK